MCAFISLLLMGRKTQPTNLFQAIFGTLAYQKFLFIYLFVCFRFKSIKISKAISCTCLHQYYLIIQVLPHWNAMTRIHDTQASHSIQTQGWPVIVLSFDVEHRIGYRDYPF